MEQIEIEEKKYLTSVLEKINFNEELFHIIDNHSDIELIPLNSNHLPQKIKNSTTYRVLNDSLVDLDWKIKKSLYKAIDLAYDEELCNNIFKSLFFTDDNDRELYYYIENALFRTVTAWDLLAQIYVRYYGINKCKEIKINKSIYKVNYNSIFTYEYKKDDINNIELYDDFIEEVNKIKMYLNGDENNKEKTDHQQLKNIRNQMTHRNSPSISSVGDFEREDDNFKLDFSMPKRLIIKLIVDDYYQVFKYIDFIFKKIESEL